VHFWLPIPGGALAFAALRLSRPAPPPPATLAALPAGSPS
jgi:hypothetical protein